MSVSTRTRMHVRVCMSLSLSLSLSLSVCVHACRHWYIHMTRVWMCVEREERGERACTRLCKHSYIHTKCEIKIQKQPSLWRESVVYWEGKIYKKKQIKKGLVYQRESASFGEVEWCAEVILWLRGFRIGV